MITEDYVSFETSKLLKEKGFDENTPVNYFVGDDKPRGCAVGEMIYHKKLEEDTHLIPAPTLQMAMKWLREVHHWHIEIVRGPKGYHPWLVTIPLGVNKEAPGDILQGKRYVDTYEEAIETAIKYCLENLI